MPQDDLSLYPIPTPTYDAEGRLVHISAPRIERDKLTGEAINIPERVREPAIFNSKAFRPTDAQVELMRGDFIKVGIPPAKVDEALRRDGYTVKPVDEFAANEHARVNVPLEPKASDYIPDWRANRDLQTLSGNFKNLEGVNAASSEWCAAHGFNLDIGKSLVTRIAELGAAGLGRRSRSLAPHGPRRGGTRSAGNQLGNPQAS